MVLLHQFLTRDWVLPNASPFCLKLETWLRLAGVEYEQRPWSPMNAPLGKAPFIEHDGNTIPDSSRCIEYLTEALDITLDEGMTPQDHAIATLVQRTLEEHLYWGLLYSRWLEDRSWDSYKHVIGENIPALVRPVLLPVLRRGVRKSAAAHGLARHDRDELIKRCTQDLDAISTILGDKDYLLGDEPRSIDATLYAFLAEFAVPPVEHPIRDHLLQDARLVGYVDRMKTRCWS